MQTETKKMRTLFLISAKGEGFDFRTRKITKHKVKFIENRAILVVNIDKPLSMRIENKSRKMSRLFLINRFLEQEKSLQNLNHFPIHVHVLIPRKLGDNMPSELSEFENMTWATVSDKAKEAVERKYKGKMQVFHIQTISNPSEHKSINNERLLKFFSKMEL